MPRSHAHRSARAAAALLAAALAAAGCAGRPGSPGASVEREESRGGRQYRLTSRLEPRRVTLGDRAVWRLGADLPPGVSAGTLTREVADTTLDLSVLEPARALRREDGGRWSGAFEVRGFTLGPIALPRTRLPVSIGTWADTLEFPPDTLRVDSLSQAESDSLEGDRGSLPTELRPIDLAVAAGAALLTLAALVWAALAVRRFLERRKGSAADAPTAPPEPPEVAFLRELEGLRAVAEHLPRDRFYDRLSLALRSYAAARTGIPALDLTTTELARELARHGGVDPAGGEALIRTLRRSDLAKFARRRDPLAEAREALEAAAALAGRLLRGS